MSDHDDFFNGLAPDMPAADRRFFLGAGLFGVLTAGGLGYALAAEQAAPGPGSWNQGAVTSEYRGLVTADPFPMLRTLDIDGAPRTALLACLGKCGVQPRLSAFGERQVVVRGSLIQRNRHAMIAVVDGMDWIEEAEGAADPRLAFGDWTPLNDVSLKGEILDTKCWFGAMRPGYGKPHKACAALCIRGGLAPGFYVNDAARQSRLLVVVDERRQPHGEDLLPLVADPVRLDGQAFAFADMAFLSASLSDVERL
ncbi:MAG: hypothetical protein AAFX03_13720 [Pseudomonadota bacterium]